MGVDIVVGRVVVIRLFLMELTVGSLRLYLARLNKSVSDNGLFIMCL